MSPRSLTRGLRLDVLVIGMVAGVAGALLATRLLSHLLFGILVPVRRATRVDPLTALRAE